MGFFDNSNNSGSYALASAAINAASNAATTYAGIHSAEKISAMDRNFALYQQLINNAYNTTERQAAQDFSMQMWNLANDYNSPASQIARAMEAGINPNAVIAGMSGGVAAQPVSSSGQSGSISNYNSGLASSVIGAYQNLGQQLGNSALLAAQTKKTNAEANKAEEEAEGKKLQNSWDKSTFDIRVKQEEERLNEIVAKIGDIKFNQEQTRAMNEWKAKLTSAQIDEIDQKTNVLRNQVLLTAEQIVTERAKQNNIKADTLNILQDTKNKRVENEILQVKRETEKQVFAQEWVKAQFSSATGVPIGAPEWQVMYTLWQQGLFNEAISVSAFSAETPFDIVRTGAMILQKDKKDFEKELGRIIDEGKGLFGYLGRAPSIQKSGGLKKLFIEALIESFNNEFVK